MAVNATLVPAHMLVEVATTLTDAVADVPTVMVTVFEVTTVPLVHDAVEVSSQITTSPSAGAGAVYVLLFTPTVLPFTFQV